MTLQQFEYIVALDEERHFQRAADRCNVTQPTLSMQVQKLEEWLGVMLFDRKSNPLRPTHAGEQVLKYAREALSAAKQVKNVARSHGNWKVGEFHIGIIPTLAPYLLPKLLPAIMQAYPEIRLIIEEVETDVMLKQLKAQKLDLGILAGPIHDPEIRTSSAFFEPLQIYAAFDHPFAEAKEIDPHRLDADGLWLLKQGHCLRIQMLNLCQVHPANDHKRFIFESGSIETLKMMVSRNGGYTLVPALATDLSAAQTGVFVPFTSPQPARAIMIATHHSFPGQGLAEAFTQALQKMVPKAFLSDENMEVIGIEGNEH